MKKRIIVGKCRICEVKGKLSKEHIPPKRAFNSGEFVVQTIDPFRMKEEISWREQKKQGGYKAPVLCERCNNVTGHWYGSEYVKFAKVCAEYANRQFVNSRASINIVDLYPQRVLKQALVTIIASSNPENEGKRSLISHPSNKDWAESGLDTDISIVHENLPAIREFILEKSLCELTSQLRIYLYLVCESGGRASGFAKVWSKKRNSSSVIAEFAMWPLGWVAVFEGELNDDLCEVTQWSKLKYNEKITVNLDVPCLWLKSKMPVDYRDI